MENVFVYALLPTEVPSLVYVYSVNVTDTEEPVVFCCAKVSGGVHETLFDVEKESEPPRIHPEAVPQVYFSLCLNEDAFSVIVRVCAVPSVPFATVKVLFRGIVVSSFEPEQVTVPELTPVTNDAEQLSVFTPSSLWLTSTVFVMMTLEPLDVWLVLNLMPEKEYFVPSIVIEPVHCPVALYEPLVHFAVTLTVTLEVLSATL